MTDRLLVLLHSKTANAEEVGPIAVNLLLDTGSHALSLLLALESYVREALYLLLGSVVELLDMLKTA